MTMTHPHEGLQERALREALERTRPYVVNVVEAHGHLTNKRDLEAIDRALSTPPVQDQGLRDALSVINLATRFGPILKAAFPNEHSITRFDVANALAEAALSAQQATRMPCHDLHDRTHDEAADWITANCMAIRRDNGDMDYSLGAMIAAYEAGKVAADAQSIAALEAEQKRLDEADYLMDTKDCIATIREKVALAPAQQAAGEAEAVAWMYENGDRTCIWRERAGPGEMCHTPGWTEAPLYATPQPTEPFEMRLCEADRVQLQPNKAYIFTVDPDCPQCIAAASEVAQPPETQRIVASLLDELILLAHQYRSDLIYPLADDSRERRIAAIDAVLAKTGEK